MIYGIAMKFLMGAIIDSCSRLIEFSKVHAHFKYLMLFGMLN